MHITKHSKKFWNKNATRKIRNNGIFRKRPIKKIVVDNKFLQKVQKFKYFCSEVSYETGKDVQQKTATFVQIMVLPNSTFKSTLV
jgi:hypothetical protein